MAIVIAMYMGSPDAKNPPNIDSVWADVRRGFLILASVMP